MTEYNEWLGGKYIELPRVNGGTSEYVAWCHRFPTKPPYYWSVEVTGSDPAGSEYHSVQSNHKLLNYVGRDKLLMALGFRRTTPWKSNKCTVEPIPVAEWKVWRESQPEELRL